MLTMNTGIKFVLWLTVLLLSYLVYHSIASKINVEKETRHRRNLVIERLKDIRTAQLAYKAVHNEYADNFESLLQFVKRDSFPAVRALGTVPDTLSEEQAIRMGIVTRDTAYISVKDSIFSKSYSAAHLLPFNIDSLPFIPFSNGKKFDIQAGEIEKSKVRVNVFEVFASFEAIYTDIDIENEAIDLTDGLKVGSMSDPSTSGNWGE